MKASHEVAKPDESNACNTRQLVQEVNLHHAIVCGSRPCLNHFDLCDKARSSTCTLLGLDDFATVE
jgi:hypothetical protein